MGSSFKRIIENLLIGIYILLPIFALTFIIYTGLLLTIVKILFLFLMISIFFLFIYSRVLRKIEKPSHYWASEVRGQLINNKGKPVAGKKIIRKWEASLSKSGSDSTITDSQGFFFFEAIPRKIPFIDGTALSTVVISIQFFHDKVEESNMFLELSKIGFKINSEFEFHPINVICNIDKKITSGPYPIIAGKQCRIVK